MKERTSLYFEDRKIGLEQPAFQPSVNGERATLPFECHFKQDVIGVAFLGRHKGGS